MEVIRLSDDTLYEAAEKAASILKRGGVVLFPTDTVYGLGADAQNHAAISRIRAIKGREVKKPISVIVPELETLHEYAHVDEIARTLAERHLPGALTLVLPAKQGLHESLLLNEAVGLRIPDHPFTRLLAKVFGRAYTATSANKSRHPVPDNVSDILSQLGPMIGHIDLVIDAGTLPSNEPSTVVLVRDDTYYVLREGAIRREDIDTRA